MKKQCYPFVIVVILLVFFLLNACKGVGIFAFIAVSDKIEKGSLPEGSSATKIFQIANEYDTTGYDYFSSGPNLMRRKTNIRKNSSDLKWEIVNLPDDWVNIHSIAASNDNLLIALSKENDRIPTVGLFYYSEKSKFQKVSDTPFAGTEKEYNTVLIYNPNPEGEFYVNVLEFTGKFARISEFEGSKLYTLPRTYESSWNNAVELQTWNTSINGSTKHYITSAAYSSGTNYLFTAINPDSKTGLLLDQGGNIKENSILPSTGLTWLPNIGAFIMSSITKSDDNYKVYVSEISPQWTSGSKFEITSKYRFDNFLDLTTTQGGGLHPDSTRLVLAGTHNPGGTSTSSSGYMEIDVSNSNPSNWNIKTTRGGFTFASNTNYESSTLVRTSITGLSMFREKDSNDAYVYASTSLRGLWRINADGYAGNSSRPEWVQE